MNIPDFHFITQEKKDISHIQAVEKACTIGITCIQLRIKNKPLNEIKYISTEAKKICAKYSAKLIINDYWEIAKEIGADGVHLGLNDERIDIVRKYTSKKFIIGGTSNSLKDIILQSERGADYIGLGALRHTQTKKITLPTLGFNGYEKIIYELNKLKIQIPIIAIGGIVQDDFHKLKNIGIHGIACSSLIFNSNFSPSIINSFFEK